MEELLEHFRHYLEYPAGKALSLWHFGFLY